MKSLLIANRGEIARRIMRTARRMGLRTIAVYSDADRDALHVREADTAVRIGGAAPRESYLNIAAIIEAAQARRRGRGASGLWLPRRERGLRAGRDRCGPHLGRAAACRHPADGRQGGGEAHCPQGRRADHSRRGAGRRHPLADRQNDRLSADDQGGRGRRRARHAACGTGEAKFDAALDAARSEAEHALRRRAPAAGARAHWRAPHRSTGLRRPARQCHPSRRARLLGAAAAPEADRGIALARRRCGVAREARRGRGRACESRELCRRRHHRVPARCGQATSISWR